ncbi:MAG TPA: YhgN family NAAT transporter [Xanthomonadales bacterium]|nr:YhgN family NAAT transporter [Xanthomonadales bacterium]
MEIISAATLLFLVLDPLGNIPIFLSVLEGVKPERRKMVMIREVLLALVVLVLFLFLGKYILQFLSLSQHALSISGGVILFMISIKMVFPVKRAGAYPDEVDGEPFLVPLAIPMIAGPSALAVVILLATSQPDKLMNWLLALLAAWFLSSAILLSSTHLQKLLGKRGLIAMERLMGMLLVALAIQMLLDGIAAYLKDIPA